MFESCAILRYLGSRYGRFPFWPEDPVARAPIDMWAEWGKTTLARDFTVPIFWAAIRTPPARRIRRRSPALSMCTSGTSRSWRRSSATGPMSWVADFTLADIVIGHVLYRYFTIDIPRDRPPGLAAYYARLTERPAYAEHVMVTYDSLRPRGLMEADYVIVGSGSAGSALAYRLGEAGHSVLVLEYGGSDWGPFIQMPAALSYPMNMPRYDWGFVTEPEPHLGGRRLACPRGKVLGGSSSINGMVYVRGHPRDFDTWAEMGADGWALGRRAALLHAHGDLARRPLRLARQPTARCTSPAGRARNPLYHSLRRGRAPRRASSSPTTTTAPSRKASARWSRPSGAAGAGRRPTPTCARRSPGGNVACCAASPTRVVIAEGRATGVEVARGAAREIVAARREVILSASSINTPKLLMLSGIGPAAHLAEHGLPVVADRPGVGANLQDHLELYIQMRSLKPVTLYSQYNYPAMAAHRPAVAARQGRASAPRTSSSRPPSCARPPGVEYPDIQYPLPAARRALRRPVGGQGPRLPGACRPDALALARARSGSASADPQGAAARSASTTWPTRRTGSTSAAASG